MEEHFKQIASLIGDPTRATILWTLLDGRAFTATELAITADTSPQNISMHLNKLVQAQLLCVESQGRHKYYKFARKDIAYAVEALANLIPVDIDKKAKANTYEAPVKYCRSCYDHLAGKIGVAVTDSMIGQKIIIDHGKSYEVSITGQAWFTDLGINISDLQQRRRSFLRPCLDWSERRHHMAGSLAAALFDKMLHEDWIRKMQNSRAIVITAKGQQMIHKYFKLSL